MSEQYKQAPNSKEEELKERILKKSNTLDGWPEIKGYPFEGDFDVKDFFDHFLTTGFQATSLGQAIDIVKEMRRDKAKIFFGFTSNMGTCGVRESITFLAKNSHVDVMTTTVGAIEEDIIRCFKPFVIGDYRASGASLFSEGVNRTGNIFVPNDRYIYFERFMQTFLERMYNLQKERDKIIDIEEFVLEIGRELEIQNVPNKENSFTYWAFKNSIPFYCPAIMDGSLGDMTYFFKKTNPDFRIDTSDYIVRVTDLALESEKMGIIAIGGSVPKHVIANAALFRDGADYAVYVNTGLEMEGSNAGAPIDEAISWGKIKPNARKVKVEVEASVAFPLIVAGAFKLN